MKYIKLFEQFVNEAAVPNDFSKLAKMLKVTPEPDYDVKGNWTIEVGDLQIMYNLDSDWGDIGFQIADADGNELYSGKDVNKAFKAIKANEAVMEAALFESQEDDINMAKDYVDTKSTGKHCLYFNFLTPQSAEKFAKVAGVKAEGDKVLLRCSNDPKELNAIKKEYMNKIDPSSKKAFNYYGIGLSVEKS